MSCTIGQFCPPSRIADAERGTIRAIAVDAEFMYWTVSGPNGAVRRARR
jgi:hypothetical protein